MSVQATNEIYAHDSLGGAAATTRSTVSAALHLIRHEPLVHFCLLGALIFGIDAVLHPPAKDDRTIVVTKALRQSFIDGYDEDKERVPSATEMDRMVDNWLANEILYREGKALGVDKGDDTIRDRIAYKLQVLIFDQIRVPKPTDEELREWFASNHKQFDEPERVGFYITPPTDEATARRQLEDIEAQRETDDLQKRTRAMLGRPVASLAGSFGDDFSNRLLAMPLGEWSVLQSKDGWHVVRLDSRKPGKLASLDSVRDEVTKIWESNETRKRAWEAVNRLKANYRIQYEQ
ncbi:MAG: peptidylprolyl isomerase [Xanthobacteraceae bacterium]|nr:peptidylprolyl isomerase [Xanthobacteraceae bacterium]